ncbi:MAG: hypothetical protein ACPGQS_02660 [Bradymonadia bacterium]
MRLITILVFVCAPFLGTAQTSTHRPPQLNDGFTRILRTTATGQIQRTQIPAIILPNAWHTDDVLRQLGPHLAIDAQVQWQELSKQVNAKRTRLTLAPVINDLRILDRDVVVLIDDARRITSINLGLPNISAHRAMRVNITRAQRVVDNHLKTLNHTADLHVSTTPQRGWLLVGDQLFPIAEFEITSPARLKHFTARVDLNSGHLIGLIERTIN